MTTAEETGDDGSDLSAAQAGAGFERSESTGIGRAIQLAFAPMHKRAFGTATGLVAGTGVFLVTAFHLVVRPEPAPDLSLLAQYFHAYSVSWTGAAIGFFWGFVSGFVGGWFAAFSRNLCLAALVFVGRTRAELQATRDFLDHI